MGRGQGAEVPTHSAPESGASGFHIKRVARGPSCSRPSPAMRSSSDADPDPEAPRPPASPGHSCHPLPWALSAALLLLASAACTACAVRAWVVPGSPASPSPSPAPSSRLPEVPELPPDARSGLPDSPQVRCAPAWARGETATPLWDSFSRATQATPSATRADGQSLSAPECTCSLSRISGLPLIIFPHISLSAFGAPGQDLFTIAYPEGLFFMPKHLGDSYFLFQPPKNLYFLPDPWGCPPFSPKTSLFQGLLEGSRLFFVLNPGGFCPFADPAGWGRVSPQLQVCVFWCMLLEQGERGA